jgi:AraC-like DNA-binding protein
LNEYHILYITKGAGVFESASCKQRAIKEGNVLLLFPNEWHRYKPDEKTGWDEYWVGFKGNIINHIISQHFFFKQNPVLAIGLHERIMQLFTEIIEQTRDEKTGYQPLVSGVVLHLLGAIYSLSRRQNYSPEEATEAVINKARVFLRANIDQVITMENVAENLNVSYAWFRKTFKTYTGIAPQQYLIQLRIEKAKIYLADFSLSIKEIAIRLNFESIAYFSRLFKEKAGVSPGVYRKNLR